MVSADLQSTAPLIHIGQELAAYALMDISKLELVAKIQKLHFLAQRTLSSMELIASAIQDSMNHQDYAYHVLLDSTGMASFALVRIHVCQAISGIMI